MVIMGLDVPAQRVIDHIATLKFDNVGIPISRAVRKDSDSQW
jgi:hypothetical protein